MLKLSRAVCYNLSKNATQNQVVGAFPDVESHKPRYARNNLLANTRGYPGQSVNASNGATGKLRFPVLPLEDTIHRFLRTVEPLVNERELAETKAACHNFITKDGKKLQQLLEKVGANEDNWLEKRWQRGAYFQYRDPVTVFSSPGMTFPLRSFHSNADYIFYTSRCIYFLLKYKELIDNDRIPVTKMGKFELDNSQFKRVFGTCRIARKDEDSIEYNPNSKHIIVMHKNHFYKFPVYDQNGQLLTVKIITMELTKILNAVKETGVPFGILTTDHRDNWAKAYEELARSKESSLALNDIQKSLFVVALDEYVEIERGQELNKLSEQLIHGGGRNLNSGNRWMDKTIQLVVNPSGISGFTYEHSPAEGQPIASICDYVIDNLSNVKSFEENVGSDYEAPTLLELKTNSIVDGYIAKAQINVDNLASDLEMHVLVYEGYGKDFIKTKKLSPDSYIQTALQLAFYEMHNEAGACYETAHLRIYPGGRTETIRSCTKEAIEFAKHMRANKITPAGADALRKAVDAHRQYTNLALQGNGVDRHFFGLKMMAVENNLPIPDFFKSPGYLKSSHFRLSTSQVASKHKAFMCYGPLTHDGYGCCYNPRESSMIFAISGWRSDKSTNPSIFAKTLTSALDDMRLVLECGQSASSKL